jgi:hypothetical protein
MLTLGLIVNVHGLLVTSHVSHAPAGYQRVPLMPTRCQQSRMMCPLPSDADLFAALRKRMAAQESDAAPAPLGPDDVGADQMGPADVVSYIMKSMKAAQEVPEQGLKALVQMPASAPKPQHWKKLMESVPLDPWGNEYVYRNPGKFKTDGYDLYSLGPKGEEGEGNIGK